MSPASPLDRVARMYTEPLRGLDARIPRLALASFLFIAARMGLLTYLGIYFTVEQGLPLALVGAAFLVENVFRGLIAPFSGALSDRIGRRALMVGSGVASAAVVPGFLLVHDAPTLFAWSALVGLAQGAYFPSATSLLLDLAPADRRQSVLGFNYAALSVGYTVGVVPGGLLAAHGYVWLGVLSSAGFLLVAVVVRAAMRGPAPRSPDATPLRQGLLLAPRDPAFLLLAGLGLLFPLGIGLLSLALPVYATERGIAPPVIGLALGLTGVQMALTAVPFASRLERVGPFRWLPIAGLLVAGSYVAFAQGAFPTLVLGMVVFTVAELLFSTALPAGVNLLAPPGARGAYQGAWMMVVSLGIGASLLVAGLGRDALGWPRLWLLLAGLTLAAGLLLRAARPYFAGQAQLRR